MSEQASQRSPLPAAASDSGPAPSRWPGRTQSWLSALVAGSAPWLRTLFGQALLGLLIATLLVLILLFAGSEDRGFIYVDF